MMNEQRGTMASKNTFLYFAYGSNLLAKRIHINNPSAVRAGFGKLVDYQLDFVTYSQRWKGASATIVPRKGQHLWGALWEIDNKHLQSLDDQEGVSHNIYFAMEVDVVLPGGGTKKARVYQQTNTPPATENWERLETSRKPSQVYLNIMQKGAKETGLPEDYRDFLKKIPHNGYSGEVEIGADLHLV